MDLQKKIGQLLVVGFEGTEVDDHIKNLIKNYHVGNIILFERNCKTPEQVFGLIQELQTIAMESNGVPLFITIDQENGVVTRIHDGITVFPGNMTQTAGATVEDTRKIGEYTGQGLRALGINFNLAPSVDINNNPHNPVIGTRSFGETAQVVAERAKAYIEGLQSTGVIATAKHFPGHGDTNTDSHLDLATINHDRKRLEEVELYPFKEAISTGVKAVMSAHIKFPAYEEKGLPATLSHKVLTGLLRNRLGFKGLIITDCMLMKAIDNYYTTSKAVPMAIAAGADLVCLSHSEQKQIDAIKEIYKEIEDGRLSINRIDESVERILKVKEEYDVRGFLETSYEEIKKKLYQEEHELLADRVSQQSITMVKNNGLIPIIKQKIMVVAPNARVLTGADGTRMAPNFATIFKEKVKEKEVTAFEIDNIPTIKQIEEVVEGAKEHEIVIACTHNGILVEKQIELVKKVLEVNKNVILVPMRNPYDLEVLPEIKCCILPYEYTIRSMNSLIQVLLGEIEAQGKLPITLNKAY